MLAAILTVLALAGGVAVTFFIMDAPRRRAAELRLRLTDELDEVRRDHRENDERARRLSDRAADVRGAETALERRTAEFDRRAITYDDLAAENRLVKQDLRNMALVTGQAEARADQASGQLAALSGHRDALGRVYLEEVRAATKKALTASNYATTKRRLEAALAQLEEGGVRPTSAGRDQLFGELQRQYEAVLRAEMEREEQARIREQMRDEQRRAREIREAQEASEQAERQRRAIEQALQQALGRAAGAHAAEVDRLKAQLADAEAQAAAAAARTISLAQITKSGFVYVIANLGSFGPDVFKIGLTRREEWQERVDELGGAAVPFPFEVHLVLTSDDAPALEAALHRAFRHRRVNRANPRKEFFRVGIGEIVQAVGRLGARVEYRADPQALEYLRSQSMTDAEAAEVEALAERVEQTERVAGLPTDED
jgi:hypothetical protein